MLSLLIGFSFYIPAFIANGSGPFVRKGTPIDRGKNFIDGRRIFGDGKTFEGLLVALTFGTTVGLILAKFYGNWWIFVSFFESLFAMFGDMSGAFIKRRLNIPRGGRAILLDQLDFVIGATIALIILGIQINIYQFIFVAIIAFLLHIMTNDIAYRLKIKSVPW
ncbi:CDP-2,3-bis-(O-geranylgeranyl)-sn-glycerol synthase [Acidianus brierleyi]|uniref:CDP-archaeol synthase n=1 Tax=Acidianus brierleyi TaxID=41673 RepID=A0A2U9IJ19_9CREN|nr:CDP-2,3-bis-(O-geranylgeranyl)-sn-glycerol synthase [Acidianus brierleyi]AWR95956.1 CDP-2,3-bis-(O-geranylgeranyl)-sn-glycerol synthase [Acidianus brierleyi]